MKIQVEDPRGIVVAEVPAGTVVALWSKRGTVGDTLRKRIKLHGANTAGQRELIFEKDTLAVFYGLTPERTETKDIVYGTRVEPDEIAALNTSQNIPLYRQALRYHQVDPICVERGIELIASYPNKQVVVPYLAPGAAKPSPQTLAWVVPRTQMMRYIDNMRGDPRAYLGAVWLMTQPVPSNSTRFTIQIFDQDPWHVWTRDQVKGSVIRVDYHIETGTVMGIFSQDTQKNLLLVRYAMEPDKLLKLGDKIPASLEVW